MRRSRLIPSVLLLFTLNAGAAEPPLRFSVAESWSMPLVQLEDYQPTAGILFDIMQSLASQVGREAEYHVLPRLRVQAALERGEVDIRCYAAQAWVPHLSGDYFWSLPILYQRDLLIASAETAAGPYPGQFDNETIGTVLGYNYPDLQYLFDNHQLVREDARNQEQTLRKLAAGRYNYAVSSQLVLDWLNRDLPASKQLKAISLISEQPAGCIVRNDPDLPTQKILRTLVRMRVSGEIQRIIDRYTAPRI
ncbi:amino acid ABC transporter substrate-binding protein [Pseudomonas sp. S25]|uniref:Amino acid ABC transporter substrate-binding protein n=1 Tax=Pseudomonas maioricensis TaxID=1766623 RepID=A0ABS9ZJC9_9PSED|nr:transporter substrate-binding domain-containing protein [Pseudomonas sp. S25]MCI8209973.1 amino acid ABC transporter substrate-binding protein [Pseudomonas sp. S25]